MCISLASSHSVIQLSPDSNAMLLPGRVPGYKDLDVKLLPSSTTKHAIWELYLQVAATSLMRGSGILHIHPAMAAASPIHNGDEANE